MAPQEGVDELFEVKNAFYLGNFQQCIVEAQKCRPSGEEGKVLRDSFLYRAYISQKGSFVNYVRFETSSIGVFVEKGGKNRIFVRCIGIRRSSAGIPVQRTKIRFLPPFSTKTPIDDVSKSGVMCASSRKKYSIPLEEISGASPPGLQAVKMFADYMAHERKRSEIVEKLEAKVNTGMEASDSLFFLMGALIYIQEGNFDSALRLLHQGEDLECSALAVQTLLKIDRVDLALKEVKKMQEKDEDATITQLAQAWTNLSVGKEKLQDAFYIYQEMMDKYGESVVLLVAQASTLIMQGKYEQADSLLQDALQRDPNNPEALVNVILTHQHLGKPIEQSNRYISQLKEGHPTHPWTRDYMAKEKIFERIAQES